MTAVELTVLATRPFVPSAVTAGARVAAGSISFSLASELGYTDIGDQKGEHSVSE